MLVAMNAASIKIRKILVLCIGYLALLYSSKDNINKQKIFEFCYKT